MKRAGEKDKGKKGGQWQTAEVETWGRRTRSAFSPALHFFFFFFFSPSPSHPISPHPPFPPLVSNLIFITAESLKQFTWSAGDMKIDNCDPSVSARQTEMEGPRLCAIGHFFSFFFAWMVWGKGGGRGGGVGGVNDAWGGGRRGVRQRGRGAREGWNSERTPGEGWVGALPGGGNLSNWFSLTARTQSCLSSWQTDSVRFSPMYYPHTH